MDLSFISAFGVLVASLPACQGASMWEDIVSCVYTLSNDTNAIAVEEQEKMTFSDRFSILDIFTTICGNQDSFVRCLDNSLKHSKDGMARIIGSLFESERVIEAYGGLCSNISSIKESGTDVFGCLSTTQLTSCQSDVADFFFYMGLVKRLGAPSEQLAQDTVETLMCSLTQKRRMCEVEVLRACSNDLGNVMDDFYKDTQPEVCRLKEEYKQFGGDNTI